MSGFARARKPATVARLLRLGVGWQCGVVQSGAMPPFAFLHRVSATTASHHWKPDVKHSAIAAGASFIANIGCLALATQTPPSMGWFATGAAFYCLGASIGVLLGLLLARPILLATSFGAFAAAALLCVPVILVTYGFALFGAALVFAYVLVVTAGTYLGVRLRRRIEGMRTCHRNM